MRRLDAMDPYKPALRRIVFAPPSTAPFEG
jgi:hypothetical protein